MPRREGWGTRADYLRKVALRRWESQNRPSGRALSLIWAENLYPGNFQLWPVGQEKLESKQENDSMNKLKALLAERDALKARIDTMARFMEALEGLDHNWKGLDHNKGPLLTLLDGGRAITASLLLEDPDLTSDLVQTIENHYHDYHQELNKLDEKLAAIEKLLEAN